VGIGQTFEAKDRDIGWNGKPRDLHDRPGIDPLDHDMDSGAELGCLIVKCKMRGRPSGVARRTRVEIEGAIAELRENGLRHDHRRHERDQPRPPQQIRTEGSELGGGLDQYDGELRTMPEQGGRQHTSLGGTRKENDGVEHAFRGCGRRRWRVADGQVL
jgi:hypothetical protein